MPDVTLGPFVLEAPIGSGAMGEVWRARHKERGITAAVKVLLGDQARDPTRRRSFFNETRAAAQLNHPGIAWVLDYGAIGAEAERATDGKLVADSPYLAMEYASRGTLADTDELLNWKELRAVLLGLLDALAHAHARGVIHRDLKPANVLLCGRNDLRPGLKLCDFGIAFALDEARDDTTVSGTLHYIAPEQLEGRSREFGPWTDLYAFGCLAWRLTSGHPPFAGKRQTQLMFAQLKDDPPPLISPTPLPQGFEDWLRTLLAKPALHRFRCAADAARALIELGHPAADAMSDEDLRTGIIEPALLTRALLEGVEPPTANTTEVIAADPTTLFLDGPTIAWQPPGPSASLANTRAGLPLDWRRQDPPRPALDLVGAGLKLFELRQPAFLGRESERDALWEDLAAVHREQRARVVLIEGDAGVGKSRLASWIGERAVEAGAATTLIARFASADDTDQALRAMLLRRFQAQGLDGDALRQRLDAALDDIGVQSPELRQHTHAMLGGRNLQGASRYVVTRLLVEAVAHERPAVILLEDVHAGLDGIRFARHLLNAQSVRPIPALVVLTVRTGRDLDETVQRELETLQAERHVRTLALGPMPREPFRELVQELLGLEPELAGQVVERTDGNPLFAFQVIGDWVERDQLDLGANGFRLKKGVRPQLPPDLGQVWVKRLSRVLADTDPMTGEILEAAAVLGMEVDALEWSGVTDDPNAVHRTAGQVALNPDNARRRREITQRLLQLNLADETDAGFRFTHSQFRDAILDRARVNGRLARHHRAAACHIGHAPRDLQLERYGRHLLAAGQREAAIDPLLRAVPVVQASIGRMSAWRLLDLIEHTVKKVHLPASDVRWGRLYIQRSLLASLLGRHAQAVRWASRAGAEASRYRWSAIAAAANFELAKDALRRADLDVAYARLVRVTNQVTPEEHPFLVGESLFLLGTLARRRGEPRDEVAKLLRAGRSWMLKDHDPRRRVQALLHLARAALDGGQVEACMKLTERARGVATQLGDLPQQVQCLTYAAEVAQQQGQLDDAVSHLSRAIEVFELIGDAQLALLRCSLAQVHVLRGDVEAALRQLERAMANAIEVDRAPLRLAVQCMRLYALANVDRPAELADTLDRCEALLLTADAVETSSADAVARAAQLLAARGQTDAARRSHAIATQLGSRLGRGQRRPPSSESV